jgi:hypothetical protein
VFFGRGAKDGELLWPDRVKRSRSRNRCYLRLVEGKVPSNNDNRRLKIVHDRERQTVTF